MLNYLSFVTGKASSGETGKPTRLQSFTPTICPTCKMCWSNGSTELGQMATPLKGLMPHTAYMCRNQKPDSPES